MSENAPMEAWLQEYNKEKSRKQQQLRFLMYLEWCKKTPKELVQEFDQKKTKSQILAFQNYLLNEYHALDAYGKPRAKKRLTQNTVRSIIGAVRAFYTSQCETVKGLKGKVVKSTIAKGEHTFSRNDLAKMWHIADTRNKAILSVGCALGWEASQISEMERGFFGRLVKRARSEGLEFISFEWQRPKTEALIYGILTPCALDSLERWLEKTKEIESDWVWCNGNGKNHLTVDGINDVIKKLVKEANIVTTGRVRWHLIRKWLITALSSAGLVEFETKIIVGKNIPLTDSTYLVGLKQSAFEKYCKAYPEYLSLVAYSNDNVKIGNINERMKTMENIIEKQQVKIEALTKTLEQRETEREKMKELVEKGIKDSEKMQEAMKKMGEAIEKLEKMFELQA